MSTWMNAIKLESLTGEDCVLSVPSSMHFEIITYRYMDIIKSALAEIIGFDVNVKVIVDDSPASSIPNVAEQTIERLPFKPLNEQYTFENYVVGNSNRLAHAACQAVAKNPGKAYNPLFIYGDSGLGKTHLMKAISNTIHEQHPDFRITYIKSEDFTNELIDCLRDKTPEEFRNKYRLVDVLLIDDIQFLAGKTQTQEEFFHTFNTLYDAHK